MEANTLVSGSTTRPMVMGNFFTQMEMSTKACGLKIRLTGRASIHTAMVQPTRAAGRTTNKTVGARRSGPTAQSMKETSSKAARKAKELSDSLTVQFLMVLFWTTRFTASELTSGAMEKLTQVSGTPTRCRVRGTWSGPTAKSTRASSSRTSVTATANFTGRTSDSTRAAGTKANSMERASSGRKMACF